MQLQGTDNVSLRSTRAQKQYRVGTHRIRSPKETLERIRPHMPRMGITRLANVTGLDRVGIPVVMAIRPNSRSVAVSQGKGVDLDAAKASAVMETVESWHAERISLPTLFGSFEDLKDSWPFVDPFTLPQSGRGGFRPNVKMLWIEAEDLATGKARWLPYEMVHTDYTAPSPPGHGCFSCSTNGLASGNNLVEAQCHAICEVVERDATTVWHHLPRAERAEHKLDLASVDDPECMHILKKLDAAQLEMTVWETTTDVGIPSFYGLLLPRHGAVEHIGAGAGTHPSRAIALSRTLTEAVQTRLTYISGARDDLLAQEFTTSGLDEKLSAAKELVGKTQPELSFENIRTFENETVEEDLDLLLSNLRSAGVEHVYSVDLSLPDIGVAVVRIVIPGLEAPHDDDDYIPGPRVGNLQTGA